MFRVEQFNSRAHRLTAHIFFWLRHSGGQ